MARSKTPFLCERRTFVPPHLGQSHWCCIQQLFEYVSHDTSWDTPRRGQWSRKGPGLRATKPARRIIASKLMKQASEALGACNSERALETTLLELLCLAKSLYTHEMNDLAQCSIQAFPISFLLCS